MIAIEETATVQSNGSLIVRHPDLKPGERVKVIVLVATDDYAQQRPPGASPARKLKLDWGGGLSELAGQYTSVDLQHKANDWRGD